LPEDLVSICPNWAAFLKANGLCNNYRFQQATLRMKLLKHQLHCCRSAVTLSTGSLLALAFLLPSLFVGCSSTPRNPAQAETGASNIAAKYEHQLIRSEAARRPTSVEDGKVYVVTDGKKRWVTHVDWILAHGYKWEADVHEIPKSELDAIPTGPPIEELK
jgi:hypothetical protein